jgi:hypothetical protein
MLKSKFAIFFALIFFVSLISLNCGKQEQKTEENKDGNVQKTEQNTSAGDLSAENKPSGSNELGIKEGKPADYPADVPEPINSKCLGSLNTSEGTVVTFESTEKPRDILAPFTADLEKHGFKKPEPEQMSDDGGLAMWKKDNREVSIMIAWDKEKKASSVVVTYK